LSGDGDLWSYELDGRPPLPLALPDDNAYPVWSPDGRDVAFTIGTNSEILLVRADGRAREPLRLSARGMPQDWTAAGDLFFQWPLGNPDIFAVRAGQNEEAHAVVASEYGEFSPAVSPDGRWLAYASNRTGQDEIWVQRYPDGTPVRVSAGGGVEPSWSLDGRELFYRQDQAIMAVAVRAGDEFAFDPPEQLFSGPFVQRPGTGAWRSYTVGRDGRFLMILAEDGASVPSPAGIVVVQNFTEELKQRVPARVR
jgi:serine/threonine-protein kinase